MGRLSRKMVEESIEYYRQTINEYQEMINENNKRIDDESTTKKKEEGYKLLNSIIRKNIKECQNNIRRLLNE